MEFEDNQLREAMHEMRLAMKKLYDRTLALGWEAPTTAHFAALEAMERAYHAIVADFEARRDQSGSKEH